MREVRAEAIVVPVGRRFYRSGIEVAEYVPPPVRAPPGGRELHVVKWSWAGGVACGTGHTKEEATQEAERLFDSSAKRPTMAERNRYADLSKLETPEFDFKECEACGNRATLCDSCLHNKQAVAALRLWVRRLAGDPYQLESHVEREVFRRLTVAANLK
jgi:hypothetical protein